MDENNSTQADWVHAALREYEGPLIRYAAQLTGDLDRARDVVQDTFVRLCAEKRSRVENCLAQWLFTVCRNRALDMLRKEKRMSALSEMDLESCESREPSPAAVAERNESASHVFRLLATLPPNQREVVRLKFQNGLSYQEISAITQLSVTNVGFLLHTAIKTIRQRLNAEAKPAANILRSGL
ncbi:MAG TPA: sigma-70 family RNA polymerase sigma factor [Verrucomicrobiae bacterium]|nr:sigma-70 family RNA polymerase sigma factor [Verrucomicrobiae bacterium]